jgi:hypothetical protein
MERDTCRGNSPYKNEIANSRTDWDCVEGSRSARPANREKWTVLSRRFRVCGVQQSDESERQRVKGI